MSIRKQIEKKLESHGLMMTFCYCVLGVLHGLAKPFREGVLKSYSQAGEDLLIDRLSGRKASGFYVDIGAHHPRRFSNTKRFYDRGWSGINIEPNPEWHKLFQEQRERDVNLGCGVGAAAETLTYYEMDYPGLSSFDAEQIKTSEKLGAHVVRTYRVPVRTLADILDEYGPQPIDFMSIDVEGFEYQVLDSNRWNVYRPRFICIESVSDENIRQEPVLAERDAYFEKVGYERRAMTKTFGRVVNAVYEDVLGSGTQRGV